MPHTRNRQRVLSVRFVLACWALASICWAVSAGATSVGATPSWADVPHDGSEREALEAIARHPEALRDAAMRVAAQPELIVRIEGIRSWSSRGFEQILEGHDDTERADLWEMIRYPEVVAAIVESSAPEDLEEILADTPAGVKEAALRALQNSPDTLEKIDALQQETHAAFADVLDDVEPDVADALESVASEPALLSVLAENLELTVALGEAYEREPEELRAWLADLSVQVAAADERERDEWSEAIREDEGLREQVVEAAAAWEDESGPRQGAYDGGYDDGYEHGYADGRTNLSDLRPYPYWYGYPAFRADVFVPAAHAHTLWYPRSHWGHLGFHYAQGRSLFVFSAPSFPFLYWLRVRQPHHRYVRSYPHHRRFRHVQHTKTVHRAHHAHHYRADRSRDARREIHRSDERQAVKRSHKPRTERRRTAKVKPRTERRRTAKVKPRTERRRIAKVKPRTERRRIANAKPRTERRRTAKVKPRTERRRIAKVKPRTEHRRIAKVKPRTERRRIAKVKPRTERRRIAKVKARTERRRIANAKPRTERRRTAEVKPRAERRRIAKAKPRTDRKRIAKVKPRTERRRIAKVKPRTERRRIANAKPRTERRRTAKAKPRTERRRTAKVKPRTDRKRIAKAKPRAERRRIAKVKPRTERRRIANAKPRTERRRTAKAKPRTERRRTAKAKPEGKRSNVAKAKDKADRAGRRAQRVARR